MEPLRSQDGASMVEYGFLLALIAIIAAVGAIALGLSANDFYADVAGRF